jgi:hypothetical protein
MKMNRILVLLSVTALALTDCVKEEISATDPVSGEESTGRVTFEVGFAIPGGAPSTKAMVNDPADIEIKNIYIAVFTYKNYLKEFVKAIPLTSGGQMSIDSEGNYKYEKVGGLYKVRFTLEETTSERHVHVLANVPESLTPPDFDYLDKVLGENLYCADMQDGYWRYVHFAEGTGISSSSYTAFNGLKLVRNYAQVSLVAESGCGYDVVGFELYNVPTRGSFLPYKGKTISGGSTTYSFCDSWQSGSAATSYSDLLALYAGYLIPGSTPLYKPSYGASDFPSSTASKFMYEHPASPENPTYIMAKLHKTSDTANPGSYKFFRLDIVDEDGNKSALIRNYHYTVTIHSISTEGSGSPADAEKTPSDYNFTLSKETEGVDNIYSNGAFMETDYVEKVFAKAASNVPFSYRYNPDISGSSYQAGTVSDITGSGEVTADWGPGTTQGTSGTGPSDGWYSITYDVDDPSTIGGAELESSFTVSAGTGSKNIVRKVKIISMKPKTLDVSAWVYDSSNKTLDLTFTIPGGLRQSMFPLHFKFQIEKDPATGIQLLSPQTAGLTVEYDDDATVIFVDDVYYSDYDPVSGATVTLQFESPVALSKAPVLHITDVNDYFVPQDLGASYAAGLYADPIAKGGLHTTVLEFNYTADTNVPITLGLTGLEIDPDSTPTGGTLSGNVFTPSGKGAKRIGLRSTSTNINNDGEVTMTASVGALPNPDPLTVKRYSQYVTGALVQNGDLPLGEGSTTTLSFNYTARDLLPITISAPNLEIWSADGTVQLGDGSCVYTPTSTGMQTLTLKAKTHFASAGSVSFSVANMTNPAPLAVTRATSFIIPVGALHVVREPVLGSTPDFQAPVYWRTNKRRNTSNTLGLSYYFNSDENTGNITIDISGLSNPDDNTKLYFMYVYTAYIGIIPKDRYMYSQQVTLEQLIEATSSVPYTLTFSLY